MSDFGDICVSLRYIPTTKKLFVYLLECQNLKSTDPGGVSGTFLADSFDKNFPINSYVFCIHTLFYHSFSHFQIK